MGLKVLIRLFVFWCADTHTHTHTHTHCHTHTLTHMHITIFNKGEKCRDSSDSLVSQTVNQVWKLMLSGIAELE